jgi:XTP/dITP diphosphohydrolase
MQRLVIASHNQGKVREIRDLLASTCFEVISASDLHLPEPEETGATFAENAAIKSQSAAMRAEGCYALADDSGLCVEVLGGAPGIYSARWAGPGKDFAVGMERIRSEVAARNIDPSGAHAFFICVLSLTLPTGETETFEGRVDGTLTFPPRGSKGFGYDPIFIPDGHSKTFAEMGAYDKDSISHRARAYTKLAAYMQAHAEKEHI